MKNSISKKRRERSRARNKQEQKSRVREKRIPLSSWALFALIWLTTLALLFNGRTALNTSYTLGQRAPVTVIAETDFTCEDFSLTSLKKTQAAESVLPVFTITMPELATGTRNLNKLFDHLKLYHANSENAQKEIQQFATFFDAFGIKITPEAFIAVAPSNQVQQVRSACISGLQDIWSQGIATPENIGDYDRISVLNEKGKLRPLARDEISSPAQATHMAVRAAQDKLKDPRVQPTTLYALLQPWIRHNLTYDKESTETSRKQARDDVDPVMIIVRAGDPIMDTGERIDDQILAKLTAHQERLQTEQSISDQIYEMAETAFLLLATLFVCCAFLYKTRVEHLYKSSMILMQGLLGLISILSVRALLYLSQSQDLLPQDLVVALLPLAFAPLVAAILVNGTFTLSVGIWCSFAVALMMPEPFPIFTLGLVLTVVASLTASEIHKRSNIFRAGLFIGSAHAIFTIVFGLVNQQVLANILVQAAASIAGGLVIASLALLVIPIFEYLFKFTTDIRLLELSDMSHPLLERLALEAPGTYNHSLMVANLSSSAALEVGANALLTRVCAYYHDIGKLTKPEFFIENSHQAENPHDDLLPSMSALVIVSHVKEGLSMATNHKLPAPIREAISTHHGTSVISYFYHRAKKLAEQNDETPPDIEDFRYSGPKPSSIEMGILLLADAVEAASRTMEKPSPSNIENLVNSLVTEKMTDGQLDGCDITFAQLATIKTSFIFNLNNMLHRRIPYPKNEDKNKQSTTTSDDRSGESGKFQSVANGTNPGGGI